MNPSSNYAIYKHRRKELVEILKDENPEIVNGAVLLISDFEKERYLFRQESSFYYLTGIKEPGAVMVCYFNGDEVLYLPAYGVCRKV